MLKHRSDVIAFLATFERLVAHLQSTAVDWAGLCIQADSEHRLRVMD